MTDSELLVGWPLYWLLRTYPGTILLFVVFAVALPLMIWRAEARMRLSAASLVLMLSLPIVIALYAIVNGFQRHWHSHWGHLMSLTELTELGLYCCLLLLLSTISVLPGCILATVLFIIRSFRNKESAT